MVCLDISTGKPEVIKLVFFTGIKVTEMLYHFNIFLSSSLIQRALGTPELSVYIEQRTPLTKSI